MLVRQNSQGRRRAGFTLMEMLIVVAIIVALAGIGGYFLMGALSSSQKDVAKTKIAALEGACKWYYTKHSTFPDTLDQLTVKDEQGIKYLEYDAIFDPWKKKYQYDKSGQKNNQEKPDIWTVSPAPENQTIGNWPLQPGQPQ